MSQAVEKMIDVWSLEGRLQHLLYSPRGRVEGALLDVEGVPVQFVLPPHDEPAAQAFAALKPGQSLVAEGTVVPARGESPHEVYALERLVAVDGQPPERQDAVRQVQGRVARIHHARHGEPNGVVLDSGDFVHTRPDGFARLGLKPGDAVTASGPARALQDGAGHVVEAHTVNGKALPAPKPHK